MSGILTMLNEIYHRPYYIIALLIAPSTLNISRATVFLGSLEYVSEFLCHITNYVFPSGIDLVEVSFFEW